MPTSEDDHVTILGFGSLLSERSSRLTFPTLSNFRLGRVPNHRRVFAHPASIFFRRKIANLETLEMSSLSSEYSEGSSFICSVFEVPNEGLSGGGNGGKWIPSQAYLEREEEFEIVMVPYEEITDPKGTKAAHYDQSAPVKHGILCRRSTDEAYLRQWGKSHFQSQYLDYGVQTIWNWKTDSGLRPCPVYLRHCVMASWNCGCVNNNGDDGIIPFCGDGETDKEFVSSGICFDSFLDETFLVDRKTTIREYLKQHPEVMQTEPPESLRERYGG